MGANPVFEKSDKQILLELLEEKAHRQKRRKFYNFFPATGKFSRDKYKKHMIFLKASASYRQTWMMAGNRVGKTECSLYAVTCHMTGEYPDWWEGRRFNRPVSVWLASTQATKTRDILQFKLLGKPADLGTGMMPADSLIDTTSKAGVSEGVDTFYVRHKSGGTSMGQFKSYDQGRGGFEGTEQDVIALDEEPPLDVYEECLIRTMTTKGLIMASFTPLEGITELIANEFPEGLINEGETASGKFVVSATWDDVPHLSEEDKEELWKNIAPHLRDSRKKGMPAVGAGLIYPISEDDYLIDPFPIPDSWPKAFGLDVGWNNTAGIFGAKDPQTNTLYLFDEHFKQQAEVPIHASALKNRGPWIPGLIDPAARGRSQVDGKKVITEYRTEGLDLYLAKNAREAGILRVWKSLSTGTTRVFRGRLPTWQREIRLYRRDEEGMIVKKNDHCMDAHRYLEMGFDDVARPSPLYQASKRKDPSYVYRDVDNHSWMNL